jgi:LPS-assembly protein
MFTPFVSLRGDVASMKIESQPGVASYIRSASGRANDADRRPEYRYPLISVQPGAQDA